MKEHINLNAEVESGYLVSEKRKRLWNIELDLFERFDGICRENGLKYFMIGGSAIGVERHRGFIPWDDDMDIGMLREDFEKFLNIARTTMHEPYHLQYGVDDLNDASTFCRIRYTNSTGVIRSQRNQKCNHGVFIELYPFDKVPDNRLLEYIQIEFSSLFRQLIEYRYSGLRREIWFQLLAFPFRLFRTKQLFRIWDRICRYYNSHDCKMVNTISMPNYAKDGSSKYYLSDVQNTVYKPFVNTEIQVASENDKILRVCYGDYMKLPPEGERGTHHNTIVYFDPDRPYSEVMETERLLRFFSGETELGQL